MRVVRHRHRLPREAVAVFKARLDGTLSNLVWWKVALPMAGEVDWMILKGRFQPKPSMILSFNM